MNIFNKVTLKTLQKNKTRTIVTIIGVILSAAMITAVTTSISSLQRYALDNSIYTDGDWYGEIIAADEADFSALSQDSRVKCVFAAEDVGYADLPGIDGDEYKHYMYIYGAGESFFDKMPVRVKKGRLPNSHDEILVPIDMPVQYEIGEKITLDVGYRRVSEQALSNYYSEIGYSNESDAAFEELSHLTQFDGYVPGEELIIEQKKEYTVVGLYERPSFESYDSPGYMAMTTVSGKQDAQYDLFFKTSNPKKTYEILSEYSGKQHVVQANSDVLMYSGASKYNNFYSVLYSLAAILITLIIFGSVSLIYNAFAISVSERTKQFGLLSSVGATKKQIRRMVLFEAMFVSVIGIPLGILSGIAGIGVTLHLIGSKFAAFLYGADGVPLTMHVSVGAIVIACAVALITVIISAWIPSRRATKVTAIEAIRMSGDVAIKAKSVKTSKLTYKLFGLEGMIASKHFKRSRKKYRATVLSLFMSIVLFISASSFCSYLTAAVTGAFQDYDYDIKYTLPAQSDEDGSNTDEAFKQLAQVDGVTQSSYMYRYSTVTDAMIDDYSQAYRDLAAQYETEQDPLSVMVFGIEDNIYREYLKANGYDQSKYLDSQEPVGLAVARVSNVFDSVKEKYHNVDMFDKSSIEFGIETLNDSWYSLTDEEKSQIEDTAPYWQDIMCKADIITGDLVFGANSSYMYGMNVTYPMSKFKEMFKYDYSVSCCFKADDPNKVYGKMQGIIDDSGYPGDLYNSYAASENDRNMVIVVEVFSYGFIVLISLIAVANVFNTISTNIYLRRREFAMLKSVGMTRRGFNKMMNFECLMYGFKAILYGIPVSIGVTWLIWHSVNEGWETGFYMPWVSIVIAVGSVFAVVFATMLYAMSKIKKDNPIEALKNENL